MIFFLSFIEKFHTTLTIPRTITAQTFFLSDAFALSKNDCVQFFWMSHTGMPKQKNISITNFLSFPHFFNSKIKYVFFLSLN